MSRKQMIIEPNYEILFNSHVSALQYAYTEYKKQIRKYLGCTGYTDDGYFFTLSGSDKIAKKANDALKEVERLKHEVEHYRGKVKEHEQIH